ncbi:MAG: SlyX family protein [Acidiferrobacterales bacterium]
MSGNLENRITDLEIRLTHQESSLDNLTKASVRQERAFEEILAQLEQIKSVLHQMGEPVATAPGDDPPPPHY